MIDRPIKLTLAEAKRLYDALWINTLGEGELADGPDDPDLALASWLENQILQVEADEQDALHERHKAKQS